VRKPEPTAVAAAVPAAYPVGLTIDYPTAPRDKVSVFFRPFFAIPILIILALLTSKSGIHAACAGFLMIPTLLMLLFCRKYPKWWYDWNLGLASFSLRICAYMSLLGDAYPSTDQEQAVHLRMPYPDAARELSPWMPLVKWFLAIPHYVVLFALGVVAVLAVVIAWFAILFGGKYPAGLFVFVTDVMRWYIRVVAYTLILTTDEYPPFRLGE
jgi:ABC-type proline/glycine betaine transport system permease subunit